ncbi:MAG: hypothetical protein LQ348_005400 [Seirophora lacunosa]|nr:MAG: hypothetical protein LQ348_005400 [Seirophora lacunosa]
MADSSTPAPTARWKSLQNKLSIRSPHARLATSADHGQPSKKQEGSASPNGLDKIPGLLSNLPPELQAQVLCNLVWRDVLRFRMTCRLFSTLTMDHAGELVRHLIKHDKALAKANSLYGNESSKSTFEYVVDLSRRCHVAASLARFLAIYHVSETLNYRAPADLARSKDVRLIVITARSLEPHLLIIGHMLERYRSSVAALVQEVDLLHGDSGLVSQTRAQAWSKEVEILNEYDEVEVYSTSMVFDLLKKTLSRELRPVSYATSWEWRLRGLTLRSATERQVMELMVFGGLGAIKKVITISSYSRRLQELECWMHALTPVEAANETDDSLIVHRNYCYALAPVIAARIMRILPSRASFFDVWELGHRTGLQIGRVDVPMRRMEPADFLRLAWSGRMVSEFPIRRRKPMGESMTSVAERNAYEIRQSEEDWLLLCQ